VNNRHRTTLAKLFTEPTRADIGWRDFAALIAALGGTVKNAKRGSGRRIEVKGRRLLLHEPHKKDGGRTLKAYQVEAARDFLEGLGVTPDEA
jgi:hypothetical protein